MHNLVNNIWIIQMNKIQVYKVSDNTIMSPTKLSEIHSVHLYKYYRCIAALYILVVKNIKRS